MFVNRLIKKSFFSKIDSIQFEYKKAGFLRVALGLVVLLRCSQIAYSYYIFNGYVSTVLILFLITTLLFTIGFFTPVAVSLLILLARFVDAELATNNLGTTILILTLILFLFNNSGLYYSFDRMLLKKESILSKPVKFFYSLIGNHTKPTLAKLHFVIFLVYAVISLGALTMHLHDEFWTQGLTTKSLLSNSFLSSYYAEFRWLDANAPWLTSILSIVAGIGQSIFQFLMIPLVFFKLGNYFVKWWGMSFFLVSLFVINLSYLPHVEIVLWLCLFYPQLRFIKLDASSSDVLKLPYNRFIFNSFYAIYGGFFFLFTAFIFPGFNLYRLKPFQSIKFHPYILNIEYRLGFEFPNVFNRADLSMGNRWMVLYKKNPETQHWDFIPFSDLEGNRRSYHGYDLIFLKNHNSDYLYFGNTLMYRRSIAHVEDVEKYHSEGFGLRLLTERIQYDYICSNEKNSVEYRIEVFENKSSEVVHWKSNAENYISKMIYSNRYTFDGKELKIKKSDD